MSLCKNNERCNNLIVMSMCFRKKKKMFNKNKIKATRVEQLCVPNSNL
jgi:hypothetical protein